jgi:transposase-like protein
LAVNLTITNLISDKQCYEQVRQLRWPGKVICPHCSSEDTIKRGKDDTELCRQRYECHGCHKRFDDLTDTVFAGHHQPLKIWILCLYFVGLNLSNHQISKELDLNKDDVQRMTSQLRGGIIKKNSSKVIRRS